MTKYATGYPIATSAGDTDVSQTVQSGADLQMPNLVLAAYMRGSDYISGLMLNYVGAKAITIGTGAAVLPNGSLVKVNSSIALTGLTIAASTMYHVYLFLSGTTPSVEVVTTAPASPYMGRARAKTSDTSRRYLGTILSDASGNIYNFQHNVTMGKMDYLSHVNTSPFRVINAGTATTATNVSCSSVVPITSRQAVLYTDDSDTASRVGIGTSDIGTVSGTNFLSFVFANSSLSGVFSLDANQAFSYVFFAAPTGGGSFSARVSGYFFER